MENLKLIFEEAYVPNSRDLKIIQEGYDEVGNKKITVRAVLQTAGSKNANGRVYPPEVLQSIVEQLLPKARANALLCELDHPLPETSDPMVVKKRASIVSLKNACAMITNLEFDGEKIVGILEILNTEAGKIVQTLIKDGVQIGFSLRALGVVKPSTEADANVVQSVRAITFDIVSNPSHASATIIEVINESTSLADLIKEFESVSEEAELITEGEEYQFCDSDKQVCLKSDLVSIVEYIIETALADEKLKKIKLAI